MPDPTALPPVTTVTVYGADWCGDCRRTKRWLEASGIDWTWIDRDANPPIRELLADAGYLAIPVVCLPDGTVLVEPADGELEAAIGERYSRPSASSALRSS